MPFTICWVLMRAIPRRREIAAREFLAVLPLFKALDEASLDRLAAATSVRRLARGERLFSRGDAASAMYVVVFGEIRLTTHTPVRGKRLIGVVGPGRSFGEPVMFLERPAVADAVAASDALVLRLQKEAVFAEIERSPRLARRVIAGLSARVESLVRELDRQALGSGRARLVDYLARRAGGASGARQFTLPAPKAAIAAQLNLTPEHLSRLLRELADAGLLQVHGRRITVPEVERLAGAARPP